MWLTLAHALTPGTAYTMPKIVRFHQVGGPEVLKLEELPAPKPQKDEVLIKVDAIGLNRAEAMFGVGNISSSQNCLRGLGTRLQGRLKRSVRE
jgi:NADPH:quinone reductase-like Zn-dependent oxidoreductase